jgi:dihydrofolate reductase
MKVSLVVAAAENGAIGKNNQLLWRLPDDLKRFKKLTLGHPIIMGRKTFDSIGRPLPGRPSIVITRSEDVPSTGVLVAHSLDKALEIAHSLDGEHAFIIGGGEIYRQALDNKKVDTIYLTKVHTEVEGDIYFAIPDDSQWVIVEEEYHPADEKHEFPFTFMKLTVNNFI